MAGARLSVSVVMTTYNGERFVAEQLESLAAQTRLPDELVVRDDGSSDTTMRIVDRFADTAPFPVSLEQRDQNLGADQNFGRAAAEAAHDVLFFCDQDDRWQPDKIESMITLMERRPAIGMVMCDAALVDESMMATGETIWSRFGFDPAMQRRVEDGEGFAVFSRHVPVYGCTIAVKRDLAVHFLPVPEGSSFDSWIGQIVSVVADVALLRRSMLLYRQHEQQVTGFEHGSRLRRVLLQASRSDARATRAETERLESTAARLQQLPMSPARLRAEQLTADRLRLTRRRARARASYVSRVPLILAGLVRGEYRRGARGLRSAGLDLVARRTPRH